MADLFTNRLQLTRYWPTIVRWNRIEGRPRAEDFDRSMRAEVRDALWMVSRQWQMGEFIGDDAGSPILAKAHLKTTQLNKYRGGPGPVTPLEPDVPLEVKVENKKIPFQQGGVIASLDIRLLMGREWLRRISDLNPALKDDYLGEYPIKLPDPSDENDAQICAHLDAWQQFAAVAGRRMDGYGLYHHLTSSDSNRASDNIPNVADANERNELDNRGEKFVEWFERLFYQPLQGANPSWRTEYLEHQFHCSAPSGSGEKVLVAEEYYHGHLEWYNLDVSPDVKELSDPSIAGPPDAQQGITRSFVPTVGSFGAMPKPRWWEFEDSKTDLSFVKPDTPDLNKLLLMEFVLIYSNDWFLVPVTLPAGSITDVAGLMVTNVFGEDTWIEAAGSGSDEDWQRWSMFNLNIKGKEDVPSDHSLVMVPAVHKVMEGQPLEEIYMVRDEIANMVWGVESRIPLATGKSKAGKEAGYELHAKLQQLLDATNSAPGEVEYKANIRYQIVNTVPEQWIPFIPVHVDNNQREIQLQRAAMPRILENDDRVPRKVEPRTSLMRQGLDKGEPYFVHEEEILKAGIRVTNSYQRTRWYDGKVFTWLGFRKQVGKGGGHSGLAFDQIVPTGHEADA